MGFQQQQFIIIDGADQRSGDRGIHIAGREIDIKIHVDVGVPCVREKDPPPCQSGSVEGMGQAGLHHVATGCINGEADKPEQWNRRKAEKQCCRSASTEQRTAKCRDDSPKGFEDRDRKPVRFVTCCKK